MNICLCFGPSWAQYIPIQLFALFTNNRVEQVFLLSESLNQHQINDCQIVCDEFGVKMVLQDLKLYFAKNIRSMRNVDRRFTKYTLFRLAIPEVVKVDRLLYLDADTLVVGDVSEFYNMDLGDALMAGCEDTGLSVGHKAKIGGQEGEPYLNAGVLLMDLKGIRDGRKSTRWTLLATQKKFPAHDQDIIYITVRPHFKVVDPRWNVSISTKRDVPDEDCRIVHYAGEKGNNWVRGLPKDYMWYRWEEMYREFKYRWVERNRPAPLIPRRIFYSWFGGGEKPVKIRHCINSMKQKCPDYEIIELNESNCDVGCCEFVQKAYDAKKYAFVADYFRLRAMLDQGGITLDADVELLKPLDDFLHHQFFSGQEIDGRVLITATMGSVAGHPLVRMLLEYYNVAEFYPGYGVPNTGWITPILNMFVLKKENNHITLTNGGHLYPMVTFCNFDHRRMRSIPDPRSYAIHWFSGSWKK